MKELFLSIMKAVQEFLEKRQIKCIPVPVPTPDDFSSWPLSLLYAGVIFGEARGESYEGKVAVAWVIRNRKERGGWFGKDYIEVMTKEYQFSSLLLDNVNSKKIKDPLSHEPFSVWAECYQLADKVSKGKIPDPTNGATHFFDDSIADNPPSWILGLKFKVKIGHILFYG